MTENIEFRKILPGKAGINGPNNSESDVPTSKRRKISLACTECQKRKTKCSGTTPCSKCATGASQCIYDPNSDRRRKAHVAELTTSHITLCRMTAKLRSDAVDDVITFILNIQSFSTDEEAVEYLVQELINSDCCAS
ncbi:hypothetical protein N7456_006935 [Penicillium angulare]|uniref:Zn(2)-C6 fungal-type domain-containing protein n=1 Tax=Penicillium angulare TaxID=116970 RepID=A0A9W9FIK2_9EURO|nr:hypothetical protein N7456_006935 [Penicillium angulare]